MSEIFFPQLAPDPNELRLILAIRYLPATTTKGNFFKVTVYGWETSMVVEKPITVPSFYHSHLRHFIWRHHIFMHLQDNPRGINIPSGICTLMCRYILYMDGIVEGLLTTVRRNVGNADYRSRLFDLYLAVEFHVGRHEYDVVDEWRRANAGIILECQDISIIDWDAYYAGKDEEDPLWSGLSYDFQIKNVSKQDWQILASRVEAHFGVVPQSEKPKKGKGRKVVKVRTTKTTSNPMPSVVQTNAVAGPSRQQKVSSMSDVVAVAATSATSSRVRSGASSILHSSPALRPARLPRTTRAQTSRTFSTRSTHMLAEAPPQPEPEPGQPMGGSVLIIDMDLLRRAMGHDL